MISADTNPLKVYNNIVSFKRRSQSFLLKYFNKSPYKKIIPCPCYLFAAENKKCAIN